MVAAPQPSALTLIAAVERRLSAALAADLVDEGVTVDQWRVIDQLSTSQGLPMSQVGQQVGLPAPTLTKVVDRLVAANLVHRRQDPHDRRRVLVLLTRRGESLQRRLRSIAERHEESLRDSLGAPGFERLNKLLSRLSDD